MQIGGRRERPRGPLLWFWCVDSGRHLRFRGPGAYFEGGVSDHHHDVQRVGEEPPRHTRLTAVSQTMRS